MTNSEYVNKLKSLAERKTKYSNKYPYNLCYINKDGKTSADCLNLIKAVLNGYNIYNNTIGYYQKDLSITGDINEPTLLSKCSDISSDFDNITKGELLYMKGHVGTFVDNVVRNGKEYNVIECTKSFGGGIVYSWVDPDGSRRSCKGGLKNGKWVSHGKMTKFLVYEVINAPKSDDNSSNDKKLEQKVYYVKSGDTMTSIAKANGMSLAKLVSYNPQIKNINSIKVGQVIYLSSGTNEQYYTVQKGDTLSTIARKFNISLNKLLGLNPDIQNPNLIHVGDKIRVK